MPVLIGPLKTRFRWYPRNHRKHQKNEFCNVGPTQCGSTPPQYLLFSTHANPPILGGFDTPRKPGFFMQNCNFAVFYISTKSTECRFVIVKTILESLMIEKIFRNFFLIAKKKSFIEIFFSFLIRKFFLENFFSKNIFWWREKFFF